MKKSADRNFFAATSVRQSNNLQPGCWRMRAAHAFFVTTALRNRFRILLWH
ncbi:hypothetical protein AB6735_15740 [Mucilaginibacter sp. RCC_168]|uniref:hypothetical protein n=1 Tax=Mucilaginibacter sp. RCC_168 TaxID=3239221 RepID=UPI0035239A3B